MRNKNKLTDTRYSELRESFTVPEDDYQIMRGDMQKVRDRTGAWDTDYMLTKYVAATDKMVGVLDGNIEERSLYHPTATAEEKQRASEAPDTVVWLDKSARPVSWFVDAFWEQFADENAEKPDYEFLNIDRTDWLTRQGHAKTEAETRLGAEAFDINKVEEEDILRIRALFTKGEIDPDNWQEDVKNLPTSLDDKNILVVDEVKNKGATMSIALQLIKRAIPSATVSGEYFWRAGGYSLAGSGEQQMESAPVWYDPKSQFGRGIGDISKEYYDQLPDTNENFKKKLGWIALSAPHFDPKTYEPLADKRAAQLQQDIAYLSYAVADKKVLRVPAGNRPFDDSDKIITDQMPIKEFVEYRARHDQENTNK